MPPNYNSSSNRHVNTARSELPLTAVHTSRYGMHTGSVTRLLTMEKRQSQVSDSSRSMLSPQVAERKEKIKRGKLQHKKIQNIQHANQQCGIGMINIMVSPEWHTV